jgi:hypothetical protein
MLNLRKNIESFINGYVERLNNTAPKNTGALANSLEPTIEITEDGISIGIDALNYAKFQDMGVNGTEVTYNSPFTFSKKPSIDGLKGFATQIGVSPFALSNSIFKKGIRPTFFATNNIDSEVGNLGDAVIDGMWEDFFEDNKQPNTN